MYSRKNTRITIFALSLCLGCSYANNFDSERILKYTNSLSDLRAKDTLLSKSAASHSPSRSSSTRSFSRTPSYKRSVSFSQSKSDEYHDRIINGSAIFADLLSYSRLCAEGTVVSSDRLLPLLQINDRDNKSQAVLFKPAEQKKSGFFTKVYSHRLGSYRVSYKALPKSSGEGRSGYQVFKIDGGFKYVSATNSHVITLKRTRL